MGVDIEKMPPLQCFTCDALRTQLAEAKEAFDEMTTSCEAATNHVATLRTQLAEAKEQYHEVKSDLASALNNIHDSVQVEAGLRYEIESFQHEVERLKGRLALYVCENCNSDEHGLMPNEACTVLRWENFASQYKDLYHRNERLREELERTKIRLGQEMGATENG